MNAEIVSVGTELLMGQIANTDAQFLSRQLSELGVDVYAHSVVGDNAGRLKKTLDIALSRADIVITTGGLGPTMDDLTKETVAAYWGLPLRIHQPSLDRIAEFFRGRGLCMTPNNRKQASFPEGAVILPNDRGTAPGCILEKDGKTIIILPGPPRELEPMFTQSVRPYLESRSGYALTSRALKVTGVGESEAEHRIRDIVEGQTNPTVAPYAAPGDLTLRVTARTRKGEDPGALLDPVVAAIRSRLGDAVYSERGQSLPEAVVEMLAEKGRTLSAAESCTGGMLSSWIVDVPGASRVFTEGLVTYANASKTRRLGVSGETLAQHGAVSPETAEAMAKGLRAFSGTDYALAVTGVAGPGGGTDEKPVGLVYIALNGPDGCRTETHRFRRERAYNRAMACQAALRMLRTALLAEAKKMNELID